MANRRTFLGTTVIAGAGAVLLGKYPGHYTRVSWCNNKVHPLANKTCRIHRGALKAQSVAKLELYISGPAFDEPLLLDEGTLSLENQVNEWPVTLSYNHPLLVPGRYEYSVRMSVDGEHIESVPIGYDLHPFSYGV
jgi:hypothetical protein